MPGYLIHLSCAKRTLDILSEQGIQPEAQRVNQFYIGSILPDACQKKSSHFWDDETFLRFDRTPNLELFLRSYGEQIRNPFVLGYYCHLYLDWLFMEDYWKNHFRFYDEAGRPATGYDEVKKVELLNTGEILDREVLFSKEYYYGDYDRLNAYLFSHYDLCVPRLEKPEAAIPEAPWESAGKKLSEMLAQIREIEKRTQKKPPRQGGGEDELIIPPLKIFILSEFVFLMETTAKEVARLLV